MTRRPSRTSFTLGMKVSPGIRWMFQRLQSKLQISSLSHLTLHRSSSCTAEQLLILKTLKESSRREKECLLESISPQCMRELVSILTNLMTIYLITKPGVLTAISSMTVSWVTRSLMFVVNDKLNASILKNLIRSMTTRTVSVQRKIGNATLAMNAPKTMDLACFQLEKRFHMNHQKNAMDITLSAVDTVKLLEILARVV
mmetsp:Transcript_10516/g.12030  ORF Transcript_10516/g.12030 Transcript_10516/m.12030 type:complete len:200 (-) Transcript_10516:16-615(-)